MGSTYVSLSELVKSTHLLKSGVKENENLLVLKNVELKPGLAAHVCNPSTKEVEAEGSLCIQNQRGLDSEFQNSLD